MRHSIYLITIGNGKEYIGYTSRDPNERLKEHLKCKAKTKFYRALRRHGFKSLEVLHEFDNEVQALFKEIYEIDKRNLVRNGLNTDSDGFGRTMHVKRTLNEDGTYSITVDKIGSRRTKRKPTVRRKRRRRIKSRR